MDAAGRRHRTEGLSSWLAIAAIVLAALAFDAWVTLGGRSPGRVAGSLSETERLTLEGGQHRTFAPGRAPEGTVFACVNAGLRVAARVPPPGHTLHLSIPPPAGRFGATLAIATRPDGSVRIACTS